MKDRPAPSPCGPGSEITDLIELLRRTDQRLDELLGGEVDTVADARGEIMVLRHAQAQLRESDIAREGTILGALSANISLLEQLSALSALTQRRERMLSTTLSSMADFACALDREACFLFANQPMLALLGISAEEAVGKSFSDLGYPADLAARFRGEVKQVYRTGESLSDEAGYTRADGTPGRYEYIFSAARAGDGSIEFVVGCTRDITARKRAELALRESAARFRTLAAAMPQLVWAAEADGRMTYFNPKWEEYCGLDQAESLADGWNQCLHPVDREAWSAGWRNARKTGEPYSFEAALRRADGVYRWWSVRVASVPHETGDAMTWIGTCTEIHELKAAQLEIIRANRELDQQRTELRVLFDLVPALVAFKDTRNNFVRVNERVARSLGRTVAQIEGRSVAEFYPGTADKLYAVDMEVLRTARPVLGLIEKSRDVHGNEIWIEKDKVPYRDAEGNVIGIVVMVRDVTERTRDRDALREMNAHLEGRVEERTHQLNLARDEAEQANRAKSEFLATMSHEIRTPMSGMLGMLELLSLSALDAEDHSTLAVARDSGAALLHIIDDILDFSKIEANRLDLALVAASVKDVVEKARRLHSQIASRKGLDLHAVVAPEISRHLSFDPLRLGQILNNFLNNAIKFTDSGTVELIVELVARSEETETLRFLVRDSGIGMTQEQLGRLFQPFAQASPGTTERYGGTGLGLVISRRLAELMGGNVGIASEPGRGTTLTLDLVFDVCQVGSIAITAAAASTALLDAVMQGRRAAPTIEEAEQDRTLLLVVDDHPTNRMVLLRQLASLGYAAEAAADGVEALDAWTSGRFAAVITDCNMPRMNGYLLASAIRAQERRSGAARVPVIAYTANSLAAAGDRCTQAGMDDCLIKPADLAEVGRMMDQWLPLPRGAPGAPAARPAPPAAMLVPPSIRGLLDLVLLAEISGGDKQTREAILAEFRRINQLDAASLREHAGGQAFTMTMAVAHRIRGSSLMLGATALGDVCGEIEAAAAREDGREVARWLEAFEAEFLRLNRYLDTVSPTDTAA